MTAPERRVLAALRDHTDGPLGARAVARLADLQDHREATRVLQGLEGLATRITVRDHLEGDRIPTRWWYITVAGRRALLADKEVS